MAEGLAEIGFAARNGITRLLHLYQRDPLRVLFPAAATGDLALAVIVATSGGLVAGDRLAISVSLAAGAAAHVTASAAEKIYRSTGRTTVVKQALAVGPNATLEYLPPETILFDGARLRRETRVELAPDGGFLGGDIVVFGRRARGERFTCGLLREVWEVYRDGELVWGDALQLDGDIEGIIEDPACFDGAAAFATMILSPPVNSSAGLLLDGARAMQSASETVALRAGVTALGGLVIARWLAADTALLRRAYADLACHFRAAALGLPSRLPRIWDV